MNNRTLAAITLLTVFLWCMACSFYNKVESLCGSVSVRWESGGISPAALVCQQEYARQDGAENQPEVTLWQEKSAQEVSDMGKRGLIANIVTVFGHCKDITSAALLSGSFPARSDTSGCAVSAGLAFSLWGSLDVLGMPIELAGELFYVRGVFDADESRVFRQSVAVSDVPLSNMQLKFPSGGSREDAESFLTRTDFSGGVILDLPLLVWGCNAVLSIPIALLALGILMRLIKRGMKFRHYPVLLMGYLPLCLLAIGGLLVCLGQLEIPSRLIPTMWSDFEFWKSLFSGHWNNLAAWLSYAPTGRDMELWPAVLAMLFLTLLTAVLVVVTATIARARTYKELAFCCSAYMIVLFIVSLSVSSFGAVDFNKSMYLMPCLWLCIDYMLWWHDGRLGGNACERNNPDDEKTVRSEEQPQLPAECEEFHTFPLSTEEAPGRSGR